MTKGQVKWFDAKKGFGFIVGPDGKDIFVHYTHIADEGYRTLNDGEVVEYELVRTDKGSQAHGIVRQQAEQTSQPPSLKETAVAAAPVAVAATTAAEVSQVEPLAPLPSD